MKPSPTGLYKIQMLSLGAKHVSNVLTLFEARRISNNRVKVSPEYRTNTLVRETDFRRDGANQRWDVGDQRIKADARALYIQVIKSVRPDSRFIDDLNAAWRVVWDHAGGSTKMISVTGTNSTQDLRRPSIMEEPAPGICTGPKNREYSALRMSNWPIFSKSRSRRFGIGNAGILSF